MVVTTSVVPSPRLSKASFADAPRVRIFRALGGSGAGSGATGGAGSGSGSGRGAGGGGLAAAARALRSASCALRSGSCALRAASSARRLRRHRARVVLNGQFALRPVEVNPHRVRQNRPAIGFAQHPGAQHALGVGMTPPESFRDRGRGVRQRTDLVSLGRKRLRPPGAKKLDLLARLRRAAFPVGLAHDFGRTSAGTIRLKLSAFHFARGAFD